MGGRHNLGIKNYVLFGGLTEDLNLGPASQVALRGCSEEEREDQDV